MVRDALLRSMPTSSASLLTLNPARPDISRSSTVLTIRSAMRSEEAVPFAVGPGVGSFVVTRAL
ncbi:hypothetical protein GCM10009540_62220 [Streptomyces turgidiscabies]